MKEMIKLYATEIAQIIMDCEYVQDSNESAYTKEQQMISAYCEIRDLVKEMVNEND